LLDVNLDVRINDGATLGSPRVDGINYARLKQGAMMQSLIAIPTTQLDEMLKPIVELLGDPRYCDGETQRIVERIAYLISRGSARDGRAEFLGSLSVSAFKLAIEEARHDSLDGEPNWFILGQMLRMDPFEARDLFATLGRDS
jgi:hypothetical protein